MENSTHTLRIYCLGTFRVELDGIPIASFDTDKTRALLAYLALEVDRPHRRERLAGLLWSDLPEERALQNLRQTLLYLRKALHEDRTSTLLILADRDSVQLNPECNFWLDVRAFCSLLDNACQQTRGRNGPGWLNILRVQQALALYRGPFLDEFYLNGSPLFDEWATLQREEYNHLAVEALALQAEYHERRGEITHARKAASRIIELAPWEETAQSQVMRLFAQDGQWSAAQSQYVLLRRYLSEHLGVEPTSATTELFNQIRQAAAHNAPIPPRFAPARHNLPEPLTPFVGRGRELDDLVEMVADPQRRLLTLLGPGGVGKTRLALETARLLVGIFPDGVFFVPLLSVHSREQFVAAIADAAGLIFSERSQPEAQLLDYLRGKNLLLALDNFEHLLASESAASLTALLSEIYQRAPAIILLVTSRQRLNLQEECVYPVEGLSYPADAAAPLPKPEVFDALALFVRRARQALGRFEITPAEQPAIIRICQLLDGLPLGVELAAAAAWNQPCTAIAERLSQGINSLSNTAAANMAQRHRSLSAAFDVSWELLNSAEQAVFCRLSAFHGGFDAPAAQQVAEASPETLTALLNQSLLRRDAAGRYDMYETIRQYAAEKLAAAADARDTAQRHALYYSQFLAALTANLKGPRQVSALETVQREIENARQAWSWLGTHQHTAELVVSAESLYHYYNIRSRFGEGISLFQQALLALGAASEGQPERGRLLSYLGALAYRARDHTLAQETLDESRTILGPQTPCRELALCLATLSALRLRKKDPSTALSHAQESLALYRTLQDSWGQSYALYLLGLVKNRQNEFAAAQSLLEEAVSISRQMGDERRLIAPLNILGDTACVRGDYQAAERFFQEGLEISQRLADRYNQGILLNNLATVYYQRRQYTQQQIVLDQSLAICREIGDRDGEATALNNLAELAVKLEHFSQAEAYARQALEIAHEIQEEWTVIVCLDILGATLCGRGDSQGAEALLDEALHLAFAINDLPLAARMAVHLGRIHQLQGQYVSAIRLMQAGLAHSAIEDEHRQEARQWLEEMGAAIKVEEDDQALSKLREALDLCTGGRT